MTTTNSRDLILAAAERFGWAVHRNDDTFMELHREGRIVTMWVFDDGVRVSHITVSAGSRYRQLTGGRQVVLGKLALRPEAGTDKFLAQP